MPHIALAGCRSDSFLGYLKALAVLRLVSTQITPNVRGAWDGATFRLESPHDTNEISRFLLDEYKPTPILNPWNSGAGFDEKVDAARKSMDMIRESESVRWSSYRDAIRFISDRYIVTGKRSAYLDQADGKLAFVRDLRASCPEPMLAWLDAAIVLTAGRLVFPYILGSGGNDGRLDFAANFAARALDVCGDRPMASAGALLTDSLLDTGDAPFLSDVAIGQFSSRHAGGANASNGYTALSLVNPWDYVLMLEGAVCFAGAIGRRTDRTVGRPVFPFALKDVPAGYGTASADEDERGELWLPVWEGSASYASVSDLLRKGRIDLPCDDGRSQVRSAAFASEAASAVVTLGVQRGIREFQRVTFVQRNGLAYSATPLGTINVGEGYDRGIAIVTQSVAGWIDRVRRDVAGAAAREALRRIDEALFAFTKTQPQQRSALRQELLVAIADLDSALKRVHDDREAPRMPGILAESLDDGSFEHRAALAVASLGGARRETCMRSDLRRAGNDILQTLRELIERRTRADETDPRAGWLSATRFVRVEDVAEFLTFGPRRRTRFNALLRAYGLLELKPKPEPSVQTTQATHDVLIPAAYALLKIVFDDRSARDERIARLLFAGKTNVPAALQLAVRRARTISEFSERQRAPRDVSRVQLEDPAWTAAALILPIAEREKSRLLRAALSSAPA